MKHSRIIPEVLRSLDVIPAKAEQAPLDILPAQAERAPFDVIPAQAERTPFDVIPAQAGILQWWRQHKIPAFAAVRRIGMTRRAAGMTSTDGRFAYAAVRPVRMNGRAVGMMLLLITLQAGNAAAFELRGHIKPQWKAANIPGDSLLQNFSDDPAHDTALDARVNLSANSGDWSWHSDYQLQARQGDLLELQQRFPQFGFNTAALTDDDRRVFDLSQNISDKDDRVIAHRLDRLYLSHTSAKTVLKVGRQAVSWGNGIIYNPVDFFNPFDPAAIDTEYKTGDDMLYAQYLQDSGNDLQAVGVGRRDDDDDVTVDASTLAFKYHFFLDSSEFDLLAAEHYDAQVFALGAVVDFAGAIWRGDIMLTDTDDEQFTSAVVNWSYAWVTGGKNLALTLEYFYNGFGIDDGNYDPQALSRNPELVKRIERGELFTLAENYFAATTTVELTPLWLLTGSVFRNLDDDSMLVQIINRYDLQQDLQLLVGIDLPSGSDGSEYGGIDSGVPDEPLAIGTSVFAQLAWYF